MEGIFINGVDTSVGKTTICAGLLKLIYGTHKVCYFKPVQTGTIVGDDTAEVKKLTAIGTDSFMEPCYRFPDPLSPNVAARKWGKSVDLNVIVKAYEERRKTGDFMIVEGAGGLLVPLNDTELQIDLMKKLGLSTILIAEDRVGAINQTLLSINACRDHNVKVEGVILTRSRRNLGNAESISSFGKVEVLAELDPSEDMRNVLAQVAGNSRLRKFFNVASLPH